MPPIHLTSVLRNRRWQLAALGVAIALAIGGVVVGVAVREGDDSSTEPGLSKCPVDSGGLAANPGTGDSTSIFAASTETSAGQTADTVVVVDVGSNDSMNAFDVTLQFDKSVAAVEAICLDTRWDRSLAGNWDDEGGSLHVAAFRLGQGCTSRQRCPLFKVTWQGVAPGHSQLRFENASLAGTDAGRQGLLSSVQASAGTINIH